VGSGYTVVKDKIKIGDYIEKKAIVITEFTIRTNG